MHRLPVLARALAVALALSFGGAAACSDTATAPGAGSAPESHTVLRSGVTHAPGLTDPLQNCTSCHGADLRGGANGQPSCFTCHGQKWP